MVLYLIMEKSRYYHLLPLGRLTAQISRAVFSSYRQSPVLGAQSSFRHFHYIIRYTIHRTGYLKLSAFLPTRPSDFTHFYHCRPTSSTIIPATLSCRLAFSLTTCHQRLLSVHIPHDTPFQMPFHHLSTRWNPKVAGVPLPSFGFLLRDQDSRFGKECRLIWKHQKESCLVGR